ncbi:MAG: CCA tRNA nucleotidyltransferase [Candidatus Aenigmarchaeota archaeon]|nr:CCA tRNA nucleotidyltransferase [Candidatus Aenigmarchaeota archaeon]
MQRYKQVLTKVLKKVTPSQSDERSIKELANKALKTVAELAKAYGAEPMLVGSLTRNTWLPEKREFDIFVLFPEKIKEEELEKIGLEIGKKSIKKLKGSYVVEYAQHPYTSGKVEGVSIDIVPCYRVTSAEKIRAAVDRTPFHVRYVEKNLSPKLANEVRLLKKFLNVNHAYGADAKTLGFSGYVCELLIIKYKSFIQVLKAAKKWQPGEIIDLENYHMKEDYPKLRRKFRNQPLILIDPTDRNRNATAALSSPNFFRFKKLACEFLKKPKTEFFEEKKFESITERELIEFQLKRRTELILIRFTPPEVVPDILWPQLRRFAERLQSILEEVKYEFKVLGKDVYTNEKDLAVVLLEMEVSKLPMVQKRIGPSIFDLDASKKFLQKYKKPLTGPFIENNFWCVEVVRKFVTARQKLLDSLSKDVDVLKAKGIPNFIAKQIKKRFEIILENAKIMELVKTNEDFGVFLRKYFEKYSLW